MQANAGSSFQSQLDAELQRVVRQTPPELCPDMLLGENRLLQPLGRGAFSWVWRAFSPRLQKEVAVKVFRHDQFPKREDRLEAARRFRDGAVAMAKLAHSPLIINITSAPEVADGHLFFTMELVRGGDLHKWISGGSLNDAVKVAVVGQMLAAIKVAHDAGIIHRDVKPGNILLSRTSGSPQVFLTDFDISYYEHLFTSRESTQVMLGVARYMPPDIAKHGKKAVRELMRRQSNDVYSACVVIFELFAGLEEELPIDADQDAVLERLRSPSMKDDPALGARLRRRVAAVCARGLRGNEDQRFETIEELELAWNRDYSSTASVITGQWLLLGSGAMTILVGVDALLHCVEPGGPSWQVVNWVSVVVSALGVAWVVGRSIPILKTVVAPYANLAESFCARKPAVRFVVPSTIFALAVLLVVKTDLPTRINEAAVGDIVGGECFIDTPGGLGPRVPPRTRISRKATVGDKNPTGIRCEKGTVMRVESRSWIGWQPLVTDNLESREEREAANRQREASAKREKERQQLETQVRELKKAEEERRLEQEARIREAEETARRVSLEKARAQGELRPCSIYLKAGLSTESTSECVEYRSGNNTVALSY